MKTSELTGAQIDYWAAKAEGKEARIAMRGTVLPGGYTFDGAGPTCVVPDEVYGWQPFEASTDWKQGGPIIEREGIHVAPMPAKGSTWCAIATGRLPARGEGVRGTWIEGPTLLIAAMRAYVLAKLGPEVASPP